MFPEFELDPQTPSKPPRRWTPEEEKRFDLMMGRRLSLEEHLRLEALLLQRMKEHKAELQEMLEEMSGHWAYEDHFYRYYHRSWKVYRTQSTTEKALILLRRLLPERELNLTFEGILKEGTGKEFVESNDWDRHTRPILEAFCHTRFMIEMAVRYADLPTPPQPMPNGWAVFLYLYDLR